jgi:hypothetical protein
MVWKGWNKSFRSMKERSTDMVRRKDFPPNTNTSLNWIGLETWEWRMFQTIPLIQSERPRVRLSMTGRRMWMRWEDCWVSLRWLLPVLILGFLMRVH